MPARGTLELIRLTLIDPRQGLNHSFHARRAGGVSQTQFIASMRLRRGVDGTGKQSAVALARLVQSYLVVTAGGQTTVEALDAMEVLTPKMTQRVSVIYMVGQWL